MSKAQQWKNQRAQDRAMIRATERAERLSKARQQQARAGYSSVPRTRGAMAIGEMKYYDTESTLVQVATCTTSWQAATLASPETSIDLGDAAVATPGCLCAPKVSAALNGRIGRAIHVRKIKVRGQLRVPITAGTTVGKEGAHIRIILVQDTQNNSSTMTAAQLMRNASAGTATINSFQNPDNFGRFRVLKDKSFVMANPSLGTAAVAGENYIQGLKRTWKLNVNFKNAVKVQFNATNGGTVADIVDNAFHIIIGTDNADLLTQYSYYSRVAYTEQ